MEQNFQGAYFSLGKVIFSIFIENVIYRNNELVDIPDSVLSPTRNGMEKMVGREWESVVGGLFFKALRMHAQLLL